jgi:YVTN family beta-propeller protein
MRNARLVFFLFVAVVMTASAAQLRQIAILDVPGIPGFDQVAFLGNDLLIAHPGAGTLDIFDTAKRRVVAHVDNLSDPRGIAVNAKAGRVYVTESNGIAVISPQNWKVIEKIPLQVEPHALALNADGTLLYTGNWDAQSVSVVDLAHSGRVSTVDVGGSPVSIVFDPVRNVLFASLQDTSQVIALDPTLRVVARYPLLASMPTGLALDAHARRLYVAVRFAVIQLDADNGTDLHRVAAPAGSTSIWLDQASNVAYVASGNGNITMAVATPDRFQWLDEVKTEVKGSTLAFDPGHQYIYMPGGRDGQAKLLILKRVQPGQADTSDQVALK